MSDRRLEPLGFFVARGRTRGFTLPLAHGLALGGLALRLNSLRSSSQWNQKAYYYQTEAQDGAFCSEHDNLLSARAIRSPLARHYATNVTVPNKFPFHAVDLGEHFTGKRQYCCFTITAQRSR
jgi:hypothetical protein